MHHVSIRSKSILPEKQVYMYVLVCTFAIKAIKNVHASIYMYMYNRYVLQCVYIQYMYIVKYKNGVRMNFG